MGLNQAITDIATLISSSLSSGNGSLQASLGGDAPAFSWAAGQLPTVADFIATTTSDAMTAPVTVVSESGTPAGIVAEGAPKPSAITVDPQTITIQKHAGLAESTIEGFLSSSNLGNAIGTVLNRSCLKSFETSAIATLATGAGQTVTTATDWVSAIAQAQALLLAEGAVPSVVVLSASNYAAFMADVLATSAFSTSPESATGAILGSPLHVSAGAPAGFAYVLDSNAALAVQHSRSPVAIVDPYSGSSNNKTKLILDLLASVFVANPDGVVKITAPVGTTAAKAKR